ncbi:MAG: hypothetical protein ACKOAH_18895, partial [Pirellula sp.]
MLLTESTALASKTNPQTDSKRMLGVDPLHGKLILTDLATVGSTYKTKDVSDTVTSSDKWYRPVAICDGPDGAAYVCDWYDSVVAHLYAFEGRLDRDRGRVYRLGPSMPTTSLENPSPLEWSPSLTQGTDAASLDKLVQRLEHPYRWQRWQARLLIVRHPLRLSCIPKLSQALLSSDSKISGPLALEYLWTLHALGVIGDTIPSQLISSDEIEKLTISPALLMKHPVADVRSWTVRLVCDDGKVDSQTLRGIQELASSETDAHALCQIACSARRLEAIDAMSIVRSLLSKPRGAQDPFFPLL